MMGSKYTVILNTDEEGGLVSSSADVIDHEDTNDELERNFIATNDRNDEHSHRHNTDADDVDANDNDDDDESFVTAATNTNINTVSPSGPGNNTPFLSLSDEDHAASSSSSRLYNSIFRTTFVSDDTIKVYNILFAESAFAIKLCKFTLFTFIGIWMMFYFVRFMVRYILNDLCLTNRAFATTKYFAFCHSSIQLRLDVTNTFTNTLDRVGNMMAH
jgi:hypothetical protein